MIAGGVGTPAVVKFDRSGRVLFVAGSRGSAGRILVADARHGTPRLRMPLPTGVHRADLSPDGRRVVLVTDHGRAAVRDVRAPAAAARDLGDGVTNAAFDPADPRLVLLAGTDGQARLVDVTTRRVKRTVHASNNRLNGAIFSPDGSRFLTYGADPTPRLWSVHGGPSRPLVGHSSWVAAAAFSNDGKTIVTGGRDLAVRVWDAATRQLLAVAHPHTDIIRSVALSRDGHWVLSASDDGTVRMTRIAITRSQQALQALAKSRVTRALTARERADYAD